VKGIEVEKIVEKVLVAEVEVKVWCPPSVCGGGSRSGS